MRSHSPSMPRRIQEMVARVSLPAEVRSYSRPTPSVCVQCMSLTAPSENGRVPPDRADTTGTDSTTLAPNPTVPSGPPSPVRAGCRHSSTAGSATGFPLHGTVPGQRRSLSDLTPWPPPEYPAQQPARNDHAPSTLQPKAIVLQYDQN